MRTTESHARVRIDSMIKDAGFDLVDYAPDKPKASYERAILNKSIAGNITGAGGKIPDYHLYPASSDTPIAFIEAKRVGRSLDDALSQAIECAEMAFKTSNPPLLVFSSDGFQVKSKHGDGTDLTVNNYPVNYIPPAKTIIDLIGAPALSQGKTLSNVQSLIEIFETVADLMRADGIDAGINQLREFCMLLFIKIMTERGGGGLGGMHTLESSSGAELIPTYRGILQEYKHRYGEIFSVSELENPQILQQVISTIKDINFSGSEMDIKGDAFEYFLSRYSAGKKSLLGQYFTPRHITSMMATLLDPKPGDKILDPFCGTGGMLISCYSHIRNGLDSTKENFKQKINELNHDTLYGNDNSGGASCLAKMNMILLGDGQSNIKKANSFEQLDCHEYDKVITNIPFNLSADIDINEKHSKFIELSHITKPDWNDLCLVKCIESLKEGGSGAIVVPLTLCVSDSYSDIRDYIARKCRIRACIRLPEKTFVRYTSAQTAILLIDSVHQRKTDEFLFIHLRHDGMTQNKNRDPIPENDIPALLEYACSKGHDGLDTDTPGALVTKHTAGGSFIQFQQIINPQGDAWKLKDLVEVKTTKSKLDPNSRYAEPGLDSKKNSIKVRGERRLGKNIKEPEKIIADKGDLVIGTLHTNNGNGLFAIADQSYICTSQIVCEIKEDIVPIEFLLKALQRQFPNQLIPTDLVGRENFTDEQILNVLIPKPDTETLHKLKQIQMKLDKHNNKIKVMKKHIDTILDQY